MILKIKTLAFFCLLMLILAPVGLCAQGITRGQVLKLFYSANTLHQKGEDSLAIVKLKQITLSAPNYAEPYLRIAKIYEAMGNDKGAQSAAVMMYRKYISLQMDENEDFRFAKKRLAVLENSLNIESYESLVQAEEAKYTPNPVSDVKVLDDAALMAISELTDDGPRATHISGGIGTVDKPGKGSLSTHSKDASVTLDNADEMTSECQRPFIVTKSPLTDIEEKLSNILPMESFPTKVEALDDMLPGRWVCSRQIETGREMFIVDIASTLQGWKVSLSDLSGIYSLDDDIKSGIISKSLSILPHNYKKMLNLDRSELQHEMEFLKTKNVIGACKGNVFNFMYQCEHKYESNKSFYSWGKTIVGGLVSSIPFGGLLCSVSERLIDGQSEKDVNGVTETTVQFFFKPMTSYAVQCQYVVKSVWKSPKTEDVVYEDTYNCMFYKVPGNYDGFSIKDVSFDNKACNELYKKVKADAERDARFLYPLSFLYLYGVGTKESPSDAIDAMSELAKKEKCPLATSWLVQKYFNFYLNETRDHRKRNMYKAANTWLNVLKKQHYPLAASLEAEMKSIDPLNDVSELYQKGASEGGAIGWYKLGMAHLSGSLGGVDYAEAVRCFSEAEKLEYAPAIYQLALLVKKGKVGGQGAKEYVARLKSAALHGHVDAIKELSFAYYAGYGVNHNFQKANELQALSRKAEQSYWQSVLEHYGYALK